MTFGSLALNVVLILGMFCDFCWLVLNVVLILGMSL